MHRRGHPYLTPLLMMFLIFKTLQWIHLTLLKEKRKKKKNVKTERQEASKYYVKTTKKHKGLLLTSNPLKIIVKK